jgi:hypothetical protein
MEELARRFCREAGARSGLRYSHGLRQVALEYAERAERSGRSQRQIAASLRVSEATLWRWQRPAVEVAEIHEVKVVDEGGAVGPVLVMPSGVRVEGLKLSELVTALAALR